MNWIRRLWNIIVACFCCRKKKQSFDYQMVSTFAMNWIMGHIITRELPLLEHEFPEYKKAKYLMLGTSAMLTTPSIYTQGKNQYWSNIGLGHFYDPSLKILYIVLPFLDHKFPQLGLIHPVQLWDYIPLIPQSLDNGRTLQILTDRDFKLLYNDQNINISKETQVKIHHEDNANSATYAV